MLPFAANEEVAADRVFDTDTRRPTIHECIHALLGTRPRARANRVLLMIRDRDTADDRRHVVVVMLDVGHGRESRDFGASDREAGEGIGHEVAAVPANPTAEGGVVLEL